MKRHGLVDPRTLGCRCDACPLGQWYREKGAFTPVTPEGPADARFVFIGEMPGSHEVMHLRPFIGPSGQLLERTMNKLGVTRDEVLITNALLCRPPRNDLEVFNASYVAKINEDIRARNKGKKPADREPRVLGPQEYCRPHVERIVSAAADRGAITFLLGKMAYWSVLNKRPKIADVRGSFAEYAKMGEDKNGKPTMVVVDRDSEAIVAGLPRLRVCASINPAFALKEGNAVYADVLYRDVERGLRWFRNDLDWQDPWPSEVRSIRPDPRDLAEWLKRPGWYVWDIETAPGYPNEEGRKDLDDHVQDSRENKLRVLGIYDMSRREAVVLPWVSVDGRTGFAPGRARRDWPTAAVPWNPDGFGRGGWLPPSRSLAAPTVVDQTEARRRGLDPWWAPSSFSDFHYDEAGGDIIVEALRGWFQDPRMVKAGHFCLYAGTPVILADGTSVPIDRLVARKFTGEVVGVNAAGEIVPTRVIGWFKKRVENQPWLVVRRDGEKGGARGLTLTPDHQVLTSRGLVRADALRVGDEILSGDRELDLDERQAVRVPRPSKRTIVSIEAFEPDRSTAEKRRVSETSWCLQTETGNFLTGFGFVKNCNYFDLGTMLRHLGPMTPASMVDQILLARVWNSEFPRSLYFVGTMLTDVPAWKAAKDDRSVAREPRSQEELSRYNVTDLKVTAKTVPTLVKAGQPHWNVVDMDHKVQRICLEMHQVGLWVHEPTRAEVEEETRSKIKEEWDTIGRVAGKDFNPRSTKQLGALLYETWNYPVPHLTETGKPATNEDAIRKLLTTPGLLDPDHRLMLEALWRSRGLQKDLSDVLLPMRLRSAGGIVHEDGVLRPDYTVHIPATGRISAGAPNTQNIRKRLRQIFRPRPGHIFLMADYDQIELRMMSAVAQVSSYLKAFARGDDPHAVTALLVYGEVFQKELDIYLKTKVKTAMFQALRRFAKTFVYAVLYGGGASTVYENVAKATDDDGNLLFPDMGFRKVEDAVRSWMRNAPEVPLWWNKTWRFCEVNGYVEEPIMGRRRHMPQFLRNEAVNLPIQGAAAIVMGLGLIALREVFEPDAVEGLGIVNQMHDAVTVEVPESRALELAPVVTNRLTMQFPDKLPGMSFSATADTAIDWSERAWRAPGEAWGKAVAKAEKTMAGLKTDAARLRAKSALEAIRELRAERIEDQFKLHQAEAILISAMKMDGQKV